MKKLTAFILFISIAWVAGAQTAPNNNTVTNNNATTTATVTQADYLQIKEAEHDFGKIPQVSQYFIFLKLRTRELLP